MDYTVESVVPGNKVVNDPNKYLCATPGVRHAEHLCLKKDPSKKAIKDTNGYLCISGNKIPMPQKVTSIVSWMN